MRVLLVLIWIASYAAYAQQRSTANEFTFSISHAHLGSGVEGGDNKWLILPSFGFDYNYRFGAWYAGLHFDIIISNFTVEANLSTDQIFLQRSTPISSVAVIGYQTGEHWSFILGAGAEMAAEGTYGLVRAGTQCEWEVSQRWNVGLQLTYDAKLERYDTWIFGATASRIFRN